MDWASLYPKYAKHAKKEMGEAQNESHDVSIEEQQKLNAITQNVEIADIGCGFGGLLFALAPKFPDTLILGKDNNFTCPHSPRRQKKKNPVAKQGTASKTLYTYMNDYGKN
jgi:2-polyprenyl-3-methyl-5-hydroxy-6-metoxy-1,4-benzoquinol methylase